MFRVIQVNCWRLCVAQLGLNLTSHPLGLAHRHQHALVKRQVKFFRLRAVGIGHYQNLVVLAFQFIAHAVMEMVAPRLDFAELGPTLIDEFKQRKAAYGQPKGCGDDGVGGDGREHTQPLTLATEHSARHGLLRHARQ